MSADPEAEIVLYDLGCTKGVCFSPAVWRTRLLLNYKRIPYRTVFLEFPDIEPELKALGLSPGANGKYTVPAIHHLPSGTKLLDSAPIAAFLETTYPEPHVPLTFPLGKQIEARARSSLGRLHRSSVTPREINILSPRAQVHFRRGAEAALGHPLEDLLEPGREDATWKAAAGDLEAVGQMLLTNEAEGPFILGKTPSYTDFFIAGSLQTARVVDEGVLQRYAQYPGYMRVYEACQPWLERDDH